MKITDPRFRKAQSFVLKWEGGLCEDKNDAGGITKYGVSLRFLKSIQPDATREDIIVLTKEQASEIFYNNFWKVLKCPKIADDDLAFALYDTAVNMGVNQAVKLLQRAINYNTSEELEVDGKMGEKTLNACNNTSAQYILQSFMLQRIEFYKNLALKKPTQQVFLKGWLNRCYALSKELDIQLDSSTLA